VNKARPSFLKKRSKRLLFLQRRDGAGHGLDRGSGGEAKVFCFFSSEKKTLPEKTWNNIWAELAAQTPQISRKAWFLGRLTAKQAVARGSFEHFPL
jgi:hypothetical protein